MSERVINNYLRAALVRPGSIEAVGDGGRKIAAPPQAMIFAGRVEDPESTGLTSLEPAGRQVGRSVTGAGQMPVHGEPAVWEDQAGPPVQEIPFSGESSLGGYLRMIGTRYFADNLDDLFAMRGRRIKRTGRRGPKPGRQQYRHRDPCQSGGNPSRLPATSHLVLR